MPTATERDDSLGALRRAILEAALPHVPFDGWSQATLEAGARDAGLGDGDALRAFPAGPVEAIALNPASLATGTVGVAWALGALPSAR